MESFLEFTAAQTTIDKNLDPFNILIIVIFMPSLNQVRAVMNKCSKNNLIRSENIN